MLAADRKSLVFVLGAGASKDLDPLLPVGSELANNIANALVAEFGGSRPSFAGPICDALGVGVGRTLETNTAANIIRRSLHGADSIDDLLDQWSDRPGVLDLGKLAIANVVLDAERRSRLYEAPGTHDEFLTRLAIMRESWAGQLVKFIRPQFRRRDIADALSDVGFVVFNYDRCLEQFLLGEIQNHGALDQKAAETILDKIPIVHPYGHLGKLYGDGNVIPFGGDDDVHRLWQISQGIKTYTEESHDPISIQKMAGLLGWAKKIVFLGFSYHHRNMQLIKGEVLAKTEIFGTCLNPIPRRLAAAKAAFMIEDRTVEPQLYDLSCASFMTRFRDQIYGAP